MATELNKKQSSLLKNMTHEALITMINDLISDNKQARSKLLNEYLLAPEEVLKNIEKEYKKRAKSKRFYDYYEDACFEDLCTNVARLFEKTVYTLPEKSESLVVKMILDIERLTETKDTSSGSWMDYYDLLMDAWIKSLSEQQKNNSPEAIAQKIIKLYPQEHYYGVRIFTKYKSLLGPGVWRALRDFFDSNGKTEEAITLSIIVRDMDYLSRSLRQGHFSNPRQYMDYAQLLIDEVQPDKAIDVLDSADKQMIKGIYYFTDWKLLYIRALTEEGRKEDAMRVCIESFQYFPCVDFYHAYTKFDDSVNAANLFIDITKKKSQRHYIKFLNDISRFDLLNDAIPDLLKKETLGDMIEAFSGSFLRTLSSQLYKHGYAVSAVLLRRCLAELVLHSGKNRYYSYAASDLKKSIDYSASIKNSTIITDTQTYLSLLYEKHKRKHALWPIIQERIKGFIIEKEGISYKP